MYFKYGEKEINYLKNKDKRLAEVIDKIGYVEREIDTDLFSAVAHQITGQQISTKALETVWRRMCDGLGTVKAENVAAAGVEGIQYYGISFRKAEYLTDFAHKVLDGEFDVDSLWDKTDEDVVKELSSLKGVGVWTAEMIMLFCMQRPNIFSFNDLAVVRGLRMVYRHRKIDAALFEKYRRRFSPYCSVASLYLWEVAGGAIPELTDPAPKKTKTVGRKKASGKGVVNQPDTQR